MKEEVGEPPPQFRKSRKGLNRLKKGLKKFQAKVKAKFIACICIHRAVKIASGTDEAPPIIVQEVAAVDEILAEPASKKSVKKDPPYEVDIEATEFAAKDRTAKVFAALKDEDHWTKKSNGVHRDSLGLVTSTIPSEVVSYKAEQINNLLKAARNLEGAVDTERAAVGDASKKGDNGDNGLASESEDKIEVGIQAVVPMQNIAPLHEKLATVYSPDGIRVTIKKTNSPELQTSPGDLGQHIDGLGWLCDPLRCRCRYTNLAVRYTKLAVCEGINFPQKDKWLEHVASKNARDPVGIQASEFSVAEEDSRIIFSCLAEIKNTPIEAEEVDAATEVLNSSQVGVGGLISKTYAEMDAVVHLQVEANEQGCNGSEKEKLEHPDAKYRGNNFNMQVQGWRNELMEHSTVQHQLPMAMYYVAEAQSAVAQELAVSFALKQGLDSDNFQHQVLKDPLQIKGGLNCQQLKDVWIVLRHMVLNAIDHDNSIISQGGLQENNLLQEHLETDKETQFEIASPIDAASNLSTNAKFNLEEIDGVLKGTYGTDQPNAIEMLNITTPATNQGGPNSVINLEGREELENDYAYSKGTDLISKGPIQSKSCCSREGVVNMSSIDYSELQTEGAHSAQQGKADPFIQEYKGDERCCSEAKFSNEYAGRILSRSTYKHSSLYLTWAATCTSILIASIEKLILVDLVMRYISKNISIWRAAKQRTILYVQVPNLRICRCDIRHNQRHRRKDQILRYEADSDHG